MGGQKTPTRQPGSSRPSLPDTPVCLPRNTRYQAVGCQYNVQVHAGKIRKRQNGSGAVVRGGSAEARAVRNGPMSVTCLPPRTRVTSGPGMLPTAISGSATLRFLLTSMTSVATKATGMSRVWVTTCGHRGIHGLCRHWGHVVEWPGLPLRENDDIRPGLLLGAMSRSVSL